MEPASREIPHSVFFCATIGFGVVLIAFCWLAFVPAFARDISHRIHANRTAVAVHDVGRRAARASDLDRGWVHPLPVSVDYGEGPAKFSAGRGGRSHEGQDMFATTGTPLLAVGDGVVIETNRDGRGSNGGRGNYIAVFSASRGETYVYLHMQGPTPLRKGERVRAGEPVGKLGCSGSCDGPHLHFEIRKGHGIEAHPVDPLSRLRRSDVAPARPPRRG